MNKNIVVAVDAMGGDNAPYEIIKGGVEATKEFGIKVVLVGQEEVIKEHLSKMDYDKEKIEILNATEVISTEEVPTTAIRRKKDSSIVVGLKCVKEGKADAFVSAGSTGAVLTGATVIIGRIKGIERPALGGLMPGRHGKTFMIDCGANVDCKPQYLVQFAKMGSIYSKYVIGKEDPKVALVNIGTEREKGNALTKEVYGLLEEAEGINFAGNIEPRDVSLGTMDVIVCDGFVGNTILKVTEGVAMNLMGLIKDALMDGMYKLAALLIKAPLRGIKDMFDSEEEGGAPFLGLTHLVVKAHGNAKARGIKNAIKRCIIFVENDIVNKIEEQI